MKLAIPDAKELSQELGLSFNEDDVQEMYDKLERWSKRAKIEELRPLCDYFGVDFERLQAGVEEFIPVAAERSISPQYPLFPYQVRGMLSVIKKWEEGWKRVLLHMPTGSGKTRTAMSIVCNRLYCGKTRLVVWLADSKELCYQAIDEFERSWRHLGNTPLKAYVYSGEDRVDLSKVESGFLAITLQSANNVLKNDYEIFEKFISASPLVVFDEAHKAIARTYANVIDSLVPKISPPPLRPLLLGLTATPGRATEEESESLAATFENTIVELRGENGEHIVEYLMKKGYLAIPNFKTIQVDFNLQNFLKSQGLPKGYKVREKDTNRLIEYIANDNNRNLIISRELVNNLLPNHRRIIFFAASVKQAKLISSLLNVVSNRKVSEVVTADTPNRKKIIDWFCEKSRPGEPRILCNYGVLTTGFDAPEVSAILIGRPVDSLVLYSQMVGRGLRGPNAGGTPEVEIVRIHDNGLPQFLDLKDAFNNWNEQWRNS